MAAYRADIEIGVKGIRFLDELQNKLTQVSKSIEDLNRQTVVVRRTIAGAASATPLGPGGAGVTSASAQSAAFAVEKRISELRRADAQAELKSVKDRAFAENFISSVISKRLQVKQQELATEQRITAEQQKQAAAAFKSRAGSAASNAIIGGAFPLLFGQGAGAAVGGGLGGALGGAFGGTLGFGLSLIGTAIGQAIDDAQKLNRELLGLNGSLSSTGDTSTTTASDISKLASQLGIAKDEALKLVAAFSEFGSASVRESLAASFGAVGGEEAFNALAAAIDNKSTLEAIVKLRDTITDTQAKEALKQLEINGSATANIFLQERLIKLQEQKLIKQAEEVTILDRILAGFAALGSQGQFIDPGTFGKERAADVRKAAAERKKAQQQALQDTRNFLLEVNRLNEKFTTKSKKAPKGPKGPEDRTVSLRADLDALRSIGDAEDRIRDLRFTGQDALAVQEQTAKTLADIERDRVKQLEQANFASEKFTINEIARERSLQAQRVAADELRQIEFDRVKKALEAKNAVEEATQPILEVSRQQRIQLEDAKKFNQLVREGILPAEAERLINFQRLVESELQSLDTTIARNEARVTELETEVQALEVKADAVALEKGVTDEIFAQIQARGGNINKIREEIDALRARREAIAGAAAAGPGAAPTNQERLQSEIGQLQGQLNQLVDPVNQLVIGAQAIGDAFGQSFRDIISGTVPVQQALSNFFGQIASSFLDNAAQIIAAQLQIFVLQTLLGFAGGAAKSGGGGGLGNLISGFRQYNFEGFSASFAEGGFVTGPTNAIIGEGGEAEYVIPASKMNAAMARYSKGVRGDAVIAGEGGSAQAAAVSAGPMEPIDVRYSVERINNVDYVTTDQFQRGLAQAAQQGAVQGERRALRTLSNSPANRRRIGL